MEHGKTGLLVDPRNVEGLTEAVADLLADGEKRRAFGQAGLRRARDYFAEEKMCREMEELYQGLMAKCIS